MCKLDEVYKWLDETDPDQSKNTHVWTNIASYCYFVNALDFDGSFQSKLVDVLKKAKKFNIHIPNKNHQKVLEISKVIKRKNVDFEQLKKVLRNG